VSRTAANAERFAQTHGIPRIFTDIEEMAGDPSVDAVYIGTPNHTHHDLAILCMRHGKHVMCEKPLASNALEVKEMIEVAKECGVVLMEAMISTLSPNFRNARLRMKELGQPLHYFASFCQYSSKFDLLKRIVSGEEDKPVPSSFNPDCSGGALNDIGIYTIYPMVTLFGKPSSVRANVTTIDVPASGGPAAIDVQGSVLFEYDGMEAAVMYSKIADSRLRTEISCEGGILSMDQIHITRQAELSRRGAPTSGRSSGPSAEDISVAPDADEYLCEFTEFIDVVQSGRKESGTNSLANSLATAEVMDEIRRQAGVVFPADRK
jgi:Predicted dehydrogenases and related proteins